MNDAIDFPKRVPKDKNKFYNLFSLNNPYLFHIITNPFHSEFVRARAWEISLIEGEEPNSDNLELLQEHLRNFTKDVAWHQKEYNEEMKKSKATIAQLDNWHLNCINTGILFITKLTAKITTMTERVG